MRYRGAGVLLSELIKEVVRHRLSSGWIHYIAKSPRVHLAILREPYFGWLFDGRKTIESRISINRGMPHGKVGPGDVVLLQRAGGPVVGVMQVGMVQEFQQKPGGKWSCLRPHMKGIRGDEQFWLEHRKCRHATLMWVASITQFPPVWVLKDKGDRRAWFILRGGV